MEAKYRSDYTGEFVITETRWSSGQKEQNREWIPNVIENKHISGRAACIASDTDKELFNYTILQRHRGGLLGSKKLQTYGTGSILQDMKLDFVAENNRDQLKNIKQNNYHQTSVIFTSAQNCLLNPGDFYLVPYNPGFIDVATIVYLAAFDNHQEIFLLGYNNDTPTGKAGWDLQLKKIFDAYAQTKFYLVGVKGNMPKIWFESANVSFMKYREFITYCDV